MNFYDFIARIGNKKMRKQAALLDPKDGLGRHFRHYKKWDFMYAVIFGIFYLVFLGVPVGLYIAGGDSEDSKNAIIAFLAIAGVISLMIIPAVVELAVLRNNPKAGLYIKDDYIEIRGLRTKRIYKKDIRRIEYNGAVLGFSVVKRKNPLRSQIGASYRDLPQIVSTLLAYAKK